jgi:hypothetical protein
MKTLVEMLSYCRPAGSATEREFCARFIAPTGATQDGAGNWLLKIGTAPVLWSSHTDTVHRTDGRQTVHIDRFGLIRLSRKSRKRSSCLGADCTAGVWIMLEMIQAGIEGLYVFHYGEERGGIGSAYIADHTPELLDGILYAVAFDRYGTDSVITHQGYRCCSPEFANGLADLLGWPYKLDTTGSFTDTANYMTLVSECTNLSVGYYAQHSAQECLDSEHLLWLRDAMLDIDIASIGAYRVPEPEPAFAGDYLGYEYGAERVDEMAPGRLARLLKACMPELDDMSEDDVIAWIERNPEYAAQAASDLL